MAILLFSLRGVPDDEADDVRELLAEQAIDFYETSAGNWGISMPALWLRDHAQLPQAQELLANYQRQRYLTARENYLQNQQTGDQPTLFKAFRKQPIQHLLYWCASLLVIYVSIRLLFEFGL